MRLALRSLLSRPSSLSLLRKLVHARDLDDIPLTIGAACLCRSRHDTRGATGLAVRRKPRKDVVRKDVVRKDVIRKDIVAVDGYAATQNSRTSSAFVSLQHSDESWTHDNDPTWIPSRVQRPTRAQSASCQWDEKQWTVEQLEYESNLGDDQRGQEKLLDNPKHARDWDLWAFLLNYRQRRYGPAGTAMFWQAILARNVQIPTSGPYADALWPTFLDYGLRALDQETLQSMVAYADEILTSTDQRWARLYTHIVTFQLLRGREADARMWHVRLMQRHPPDAALFSKMFVQTLHIDENEEVLGTIYETGGYRTMYDHIVSKLCRLKNFTSAYGWHVRLLSFNDLPKSARSVVPLVHYYMTYKRRVALGMTNSLVDAGLSFASELRSTVEKLPAISSEMLNRVYEDTQNLEHKRYNDGLGARWFATAWVSLDVAINTVHALGFQEIGPLSLQAIALREPDQKSVRHRIEQLSRLGISTGKSVFSRSLVSFASHKNAALLKGLLESDQHPDALEDLELQKKLLNVFADANDWESYRRTLAIQLAVSKSPIVQKESLRLEYFAYKHDFSAVFALLAEMQANKMPISVKTIASLLRCLLRPRRKGHRPVVQKYNSRDLQKAIDMLKGIMDHGGHVPAVYWIEILKRLGMEGRIEDLGRICVMLAVYYDPERSDQFPFVTAKGPTLTLPDMPFDHPYHPNQILFSASFQRAVVECGFIRTVGRSPTRKGYEPVTTGILVLKQLRRLKVRIHSAAIRKAIINRLVVYYGPGISERKANRIAKRKNRLTLEQMMQQIDDAIGFEAFPGVDMRRLVYRRAASKMGKAKYIKRRIFFSRTERPYYY